MNTGLAITVYLAAAFFASLIAAVKARGRRRHPGYWMVFSFLVPPSVLLLLFLPPGRGVHHPADPYLDRDDDDDL